MTVAMTPPMKSPALVSISAAIPLDLNSCRRDIERAAQMKMTPTTSSLTIRECLLSVGLSPCQASNRTMQARVRREVKHLVNGSTRKIPWGEKSRPPAEITVRTFATPGTTMMTSIINNNHNNDDFDSQVNGLFQEVDDISLLSEPTCFLQPPLPPQQQQQLQQQQQPQQAPTPPPQRLVTTTPPTMSPYPNPTIRTVTTSVMLVEPHFPYVHPAAAAAAATSGVAAMAAAAAASAATTLGVSVNPLLFPQQQYRNLYHPHTSQQQQQQQVQQQMQQQQPNQASRNDRNQDSTTTTTINNNMNHPSHHNTNARPMDFTLDAVNKWLEAEAMV